MSDCLLRVWRAAAGVGMADMLCLFVESVSAGCWQAR
jgi:hypothetical protein